MTCSHWSDIKRLRGKLEGKYRLRVGEYRAVYSVDEKEKTVIIMDIRLRKSIY
ncbi:hypothetical protein DRN98_09955 [Methanosarcinales archaeon]|nr:MAG: hypothetical protein DRN98_09955 [Methanosarcinales archaeon]